MKYSLIYKEGKVWSDLSMLSKIDNAAKKGMKVYASLCQCWEDSQKWEINFDCTDEDRDVGIKESCYEFGDISTSWEAVRTELEQGRIPEDWSSRLENEKTKGDGKMEAMQEIEVQEQENQEEENNVERSDQAVTRSQEDDLPPITKDSAYAVLVRRGEYQLNMQVCGDMTTMQSEGCKLYLTDVKTGKLYISSSSEITISRARLLSAIDHTVMGVLSTFLVNFGEDDMKKAYERATQYLKVVKNITKTPSSRNIQDIFVDIVDSAKRKAQEASISEEPSDDYKYNEQEGTVAILSSQMQKLLDEVDAGCTKTVFCKKLRMVEQHIGKKIIISNRGGTGYGYNDTNNRRYYKFTADPFGTDNKEA